jgi:tRNA (cmo5U34)-methyltransferase
VPRSTDASEPTSSDSVDQLFAEAPPQSSDFAFDARTASVFDDMVSRSVPFYGEFQRMVTELAGDFAVPGTNLYDLGCATGTTLLALEDGVEPSVAFVGFDNSDDMLAQAQQKMDALPSDRERRLIQGDLNDEFTIENASVVILLLTLQFVRPLHRGRVIKLFVRG